MSDPALGTSVNISMTLWPFAPSSSTTSCSTFQLVRHRSLRPWESSRKLSRPK
jgi:hypothetical protein